MSEPHHTQVVDTHDPDTPSARPHPDARDPRGAAPTQSAPITRATHRPANPLTTITPAPLRVATWLTPRERAQVEAAGAGHFIVRACPTLAAARDAIAAGNADAMLVSAALVRPPVISALGALVRRVPTGFAVGLVGDVDEPRAIEGAFELGRAGVTRIVDARSPNGWAALRAALSPALAPDAYMRLALATILADISGSARAIPAHEDASERHAAGPSDGLLRFLAAVFTPGVRTAHAVAERLGVVPSSLASRFSRAGLPSVKRYLVGARLIYFAHLAERPGVSLAAIAHYLDASSPQSLGRMVRQFTGMCAGQLRQSYTGAAMLERFRAELIRPRLEVLRSFDPLAPAWREAARAGRTTPRTTVGAGRVAS